MIWDGMKQRMLEGGKTAKLLHFLLHCLSLNASLTVPGGGGETPSPVGVLDDSGGGKNEVSPGKRWLAGGIVGPGGIPAEEWGGRNGGLVAVGFSKESMQKDLLLCKYR